MLTTKTPKTRAAMQNLNRNIASNFSMLSVEEEVTSDENSEVSDLSDEYDLSEASKLLYNTVIIPHLHISYYGCTFHYPQC